MDRHRTVLQDLIRQHNNACIDCANPNPQWASLSFAVFLCLQCAGVHRGFGVHVSFVRSVSMDTWHDDQLRRMQLGGNAPFTAFLQSYSPADQGGYKHGMDPYDTYHSWAATQYRDKLDAELAGMPWAPSPPPSSISGPDRGAASLGRPSSAQGLRKSRASNRPALGSSLHEMSGSPSSASHSGQNTPDLRSLDQKTANETYFASLGQKNAARPADLPPSQGGRYVGFGSTPSPPINASQHPSFGLSSGAAPSLSELQENPVAALSKGWSLLSAAVAGASRAVAENVIQPGIERVSDPNFQASVKGYVAGASRTAQMVGRSANEWSKTQLGVDVAEQVGGVVETVKGTLSGPERRGYGLVGGQGEAEHAPLYHDDQDDFFAQHSYSQSASGQQISSIPDTTQSSSASAKNTDTKAAGWDEWEDF